MEEEHKQTTLREFIEWLSSWEDLDNTIVQVPGYGADDIVAGSVNFDKEDYRLWQHIVLKGNPKLEGEQMGEKDVLVLGEILL